MKGLITINIDEVDASVREQAKLDMDEKYRTLRGHFRHEIGHYYWGRLIRGACAGRFDAFPAGVGAEGLDDAQAQSAHDASGAPADWQEPFISAYACMHPREDWAETWALDPSIIDTWIPLTFALNSI